MGGKTAFPVDIYDFRPAGTDQALTADATEGGKKLTAYGAPVTHGFITFAGADCMVTLDGSAPTATNGHCIPKGTIAIWPLAWLTAAKFIRPADTSVTVHVTPLTRSGQP